MSEDLADEPFRQTVKRVEDAYGQSAEELKAKVRKAKEEALKKVTG